MNATEQQPHRWAMVEFVWGSYYVCDMCSLEVRSEEQMEAAIADGCFAVHGV